MPKLLYNLELTREDLITLTASVINSRTALIIHSPTNPAISTLDGLFTKLKELLEG